MSYQYPMHFDYRVVKALREERHWTMIDLAKKIGRTRQALYYLEQGMVEPSARTLGRLAEAFDVSIDAFYKKRAR